MYRALARLVPHLGLTLHDPRCTPEPIEQLDVRKPDITLFQMMDESDTSTADVAKVIGRLRMQLGLSEKEYTDSLRILECDGGTSMLVESLRRNRFPFRRLYDGLGTTITVPGVAHLQWCIGAAIYRRYFEDPLEGSKYRGSLFITANLLDRKGLDPQKIKDYNQMERLLRGTAQLELLSCVDVCTGMMDYEGGSDVVDWRCGPKVRPVRRGWLIHVGAKNGPSGSVREPAPSRK
ncbi:BQ5605_C006g04186 [Microbotryum silenes-dioicae]|uniref:BQ5605_C006g04186 protein n=1 Tax=Microbotryum silenes-dioicae TaxID=796604 RepID=A0A2X0M679_9BASI|nr:BQ5605_C006g04186 [Microbotryum silenes-dioicae]